MNAKNNVVMVTSLKSTRIIIHYFLIVCVSALTGNASAQHPLIEKYSTVIKNAQMVETKKSRPIDNAYEFALYFVQHVLDLQHSTMKSLSSDAIARNLADTLEDILRNHENAKNLDMEMLLNIIQYADYLNIEMPVPTEDATLSFIDFLCKHIKPKITEYPMIIYHSGLFNASSFYIIADYLRQSVGKAKPFTLFESYVVDWLNDHKNYFSNQTELLGSTEPFAQKLLYILNKSLFDATYITNRQNVPSAYLLPLVGIYELLQLPPDNTLYEELIKQAALSINKKTIDTLLKYSGKVMGTVTQEDIIKALSIVSPNVLSDILLKTLKPHTKQLRGVSHSITCVAFSPITSELVAGSAGTSITIWDINKSSIIKTLHSHTQDITSIAYSHDGKVIASGSGDKTIGLWDAYTGRPLHMLTGHTDEVYCVAFSPNDSILASGGWDNTLRLWDPNTATLMHTLQGHTNEINTIAFSPNGNLLASAGWDSTILVWNIEKRTIVHRIQEHTHAIWTVAFSPDGRMFASGSDDRNINLYNTTTGKLINTLKGHTDTVWSVAFSPDGRTLASGSGDKTIKLWDTKTGNLIETLTGHTDLVLSVCFNKDGSILASGSSDKTIRLWHMRSTLDTMMRALYLAIS